MCDLCRAATQTTSTTTSNTRSCMWDYSSLRRCARVAADMLVTLKSAMKGKRLVPKATALD